MTRTRTALASAMFLATAFGQAQAADIVIDFEADSLGFFANGFTSVDSPLVAFSNTAESEVRIIGAGTLTPPEQADGQGLVVVDDGATRGGVQLDFAQAVSAVTLSFGNDDPAFADAGTLANLEGFSNGVSVGSVDVVVNLDDVLNQSITLSGLTMDRVVFTYLQADRSPSILFEIIDNISADFAPIPLPGAAPLFAAALAGFGARRLKRG
ncbi:MAG: hypothetical protein AAGH41_13380 [Pseudomonadota bacterium]